MTLPWYAYLEAFLLLAIPLGLSVCLLASPWLSARAQREYRSLTSSAAPESESVQAEEVQRRYDRSVPVWVQLAFWTLLLVTLPLLINADAVGALDRFVPSQLTDVLGLLSMGATVPVLFFVSCLLCGYVESRRDARSETAATQQPSPPTPERRARQFGTASVASLLALIPLVPLVLNLPILRDLEFEQKVNIAAGICISGVTSSLLCGVLAFVFGRKMAVSARIELGPDDSLRRFVEEVGRRADVPIHRVLLVNVPQVNAFAAHGGTIGFTLGLVQNMSPQEVCVILAHEIGHLKHGDPRRERWLSLAENIGFAAWILGATPLLAKCIPENYLWTLVAGPAFLFGPLYYYLTGRGRRRREEAADRFAVAVTRDPELVIRTLQKLHRLNAQPNRLRPDHEALSTHPSLAHRIEAIRRLPLPTSIT